VDVDAEVGGDMMKRILVVGCAIVLALIVMDANVVKTSSGLSLKAGQALAADLHLPPPPVGKGKAPVVGKGKAPIMTK
jgi:hypothetical protein